MSGRALVLVGHGSTRHPDGAQPIFALADDIRRLGVFSEVVALFMKQAPYLSEMDHLVGSADIVVVPVFAGQGYYTQTLIPAEMRLAGPITRRDGRRIVYTAPAGTHPRLPQVLLGRAERAALAGGMEPARSAVLLIAHGSSRPGGAGDTPQAIRAAMAAAGRFSEVGLVFLEQPPLASQWASQVRCHDVAAMPLLVAQGLHASRDIPGLFGLGAHERGPVEVEGHRVVLTGGLGAEPELIAIILDLAGTATVSP